MSSKDFTRQVFDFLDHVVADHDLPPSAEAIAIVLAQHFNETEGGAAWPSCRTIAAAIGADKATVLRTLRCMEQRGHLRIEWGRQGRGRVSRFWMAGNSAPAHLRKVHQRTFSGDKKGASVSQKRCGAAPLEARQCTRTIIENHSIEPYPPIVPQGGQAACDFGFDDSKQAVMAINNKPNTGSHSVNAMAAENRAATESRERSASVPRRRAVPRPAMDQQMVAEFEAWYSAYPRHEARGAAEKAYAAARKITSPEVLLAGAQGAKQKYTDPKFTPLPATWLNQKRWLDEAPPSSESWLARRFRTGADYV